MRTETEIKAAIQKLLDDRILAKRLPIFQSDAYIETLNVQVRVLRWVLGYKQPVYYWCIRCQVSHRGLQCPHCGGDRPLTLKGMKPLPGKE